MERLFDLVKAKHDIATLELVFEAYKTPSNGERLRKEKLENYALNQELDVLVTEYIDYGNKWEHFHQDGPPPTDIQIGYLESISKELSKKIETLSKKAQKIFYDKGRLKTVMLILNENLLNLLELTLGEERSFHTLEKMACRKRPYQEFLLYQFKQEDYPLNKLEYPFFKHLYLPDQPTPGYSQYGYQVPPDIQRDTQSGGCIAMDACQSICFIYLHLP